ncbi:hypothetical protein HYPSUDRAFT_34744 [Hypholoma sublateritium FD-334 SS-4]|uniref:Uncharacterized protein n=1 Tax=Hypholoma sublateritium (strain FD-334 SS-4) TaxID=945553 RepID=A0A0D2LJ21_HYPSF|nr:hypothetical protein HYPSUDRAFT_34744 [Hypholoma sublateritium FD-334 SS-4]
MAWFFVLTLSLWLLVIIFKFWTYCGTFINAFIKRIRFVRFQRLKLKTEVSS